MALHRSIMVLAIALLFACPVLAEEETANQGAALYEQGNRLLKEGKIDEAFNTYIAAAKASPDTESYLETARLVGRVRILRQTVANTKVSDKWEKMVHSLHTFYLANEIYGEALALDKKAHDKLQNQMSATHLTETLLRMEKNKGALDFLNSLDTELLTPRNNVYRGIALARLGRMDEAMQTRESCAVSCDSSPSSLYDIARLHSLLGKQEDAISLLTLSFERTPPSKLVSLKKSAGNCPDFASLRSAADFQKILQTQSKIKESSCSSGSSCSSCPSRGGCSKSKKEK